MINWHRFGLAHLVVWFVFVLIVTYAVMTHLLPVPVIEDREQHISRVCIDGYVFIEKQSTIVQLWSINQHGFATPAICGEYRTVERF